MSIWDGFHAQLDFRAAPLAGRKTSTPDWTRRAPLIVPTLSAVAALVAFAYGHWMIAAFAVVQGFGCLFLAGAADDDAAE